MVYADLCFWYDIKKKPHIAVLLVTKFKLALLTSGEGNGTPLQYSCLENPMDRGAWWATVRGVERIRHD